MPNSINSLSPSFRDYLLLKNLVTDTVVDNGLQSLLGGVGYPASVETLPNAVQPSNSISNTGTIYQELNTILNPYQGGIDDYSQVNIILNQSTNSTIGNQGIYSNSNELLTGQFVSNGNLTNSNEIREGMTIKNIYVDVPKQSIINLNTQPVPTFQNLKSYIDENNNLNIGGPSTQVADIIGGIVGGQGVGFDANNGNLVSNEDIRSTLLGRVLGATGTINDTPLGDIGGQQLLAHIGYNAAFGIQQETLGSLNLNPLTLLQGKSLINLNYSITVPKGTVGKVLNYAANMLGVQSPISLLEESSSIFTFSNKLEYIGQTNIDRANEMLKNSGKGQVQSLINHMRSNTLVSNPNGTTLRQGYAPGYKDDRITKGENAGDGINPYLYARGDSNGGIIDFLNGKDNSPIASGNYDRPGQISNDGWNEDYRGFYASEDKPVSESAAELSNYIGGKKYKNAFGWTDEYNNTPENVKDFNQGTQFNNKKTLLYKTRKLFETNKMQTLVTGHGVKNDKESQIQSAVSSVGGFVSKGSGVLSYNALINGVSDDPAKVFCRTWTTYDRYDDVIDLQKNRGLYGSNGNIFRRNTELSVLDNNGFARINPYKTDKMSKSLGFTTDGFNGYTNNTDNKRYMFSIENLAWNDSLENLLACEVGPGDQLSGHRGRIMWFPPYDINFSESTSASWDKHNFIGRGEPIYTYNNTERTGNLSWKIIIDHPNYLNFIGGADGITASNFDDYVASFFAGCVPMEEAKKVLTPSDIAKTETANAQTKPEEKLDEQIAPQPFNIYFPNDVYDVNLYPSYEDGLCISNSQALLTLTGHTNSIYSAVYNPDGTKVATASFDNTARIWDPESGTTLHILIGHTNPVHKICFSPDGTKVATASFDNTAKIWDVSTGLVIHTLTGHTASVYDVSFSPDGSKLATSSQDKTAKIWDATTGLITHTLTGHTQRIPSISFSPDGTKLVTGSWDNTARIWNIQSGITEHILIGHTDSINYVLFNPDGNKVVTASDDDTAKVWNVESGTTITTLTHPSLVFNAKFSPDGTKIATSCFDDNARIWNTSGSIVYTLKGHTEVLYDINFNFDGTKIVTTSSDNTARIWDVSDGSELQILEGHQSTVNTAVFNPDGTNVLTSSVDKTAKIWEVSEFNCFINRATNVTGEGNGLGSYTEMCYQFMVNGKKTWSSTQCSQTNGVTQGSPGRLEPDRTDFGLNGTGTTESYVGTRLIKDGKKYPSWRDETYKTDLQNYLLTKCKNCRVEVVGYASTVGTFGDNRNDELSRLRAINVMEWLKTNILTDPPFTDRISIKADGQGATRDGGNCPEPNASERKRNYLKSKNDVFGCKVNRYVTVRFVVDPNLNPETNPKPEKETVTPPKILLPRIDPSRLYTECDYFQKLEISDPVVYSTLKDKIKYFQPAFHSTTPEGFNSRLTFLQQCMRQGPTTGVVNNNNPNNLAFGRPPVCILRIGDFYHTKIIIENLNFTFEPLVWDLNPEGVGVQPMICNVDMSFSFIGGSSLSGPINKLQNAISFNYFANTEVYDPRADSIQIKDDKGVIVDGDKTIAASSFNGTNVTPEANQIAQNNNANANLQPLTNPSGSTSGSTSGTTTTNVPSDPDATVFSNASALNNFKIWIDYSGDKLEGSFTFAGNSLTKDYDAKLKLWSVNGVIDVATFKISGENSEKPNTGNFITESEGWRDILDKTADKKTRGVVFFIEIPAYKDYKFFITKAIALFECPDLGIKTNDILYPQDWEIILEDPCCVCWPNGTNNNKIIVTNSQGITIQCPSSGCTSN